MVKEPRVPSVPVCRICGRSQKATPLVLQRSLVDWIARPVPSWDPNGFICVDDLNRFRTHFVRALLEDEIGEITSLEQSVVDRLASHETLASNVDAAFERALAFGERLVDRVAEFGGSWRFIALFALVMAAWMLTNSVLLVRDAFDLYPCILLNLMLSCLAAVQAPVIMTSQNRQEARDRLRPRSDYLVNLKGELGIRLLHEKIDHVLQHQWERLMEIQEIQVELMNELAQRVPAQR